MKIRNITFAIVFAVLVTTSSYLLMSSAQEEEDVWDFEGIMRVQSDEDRLLIFNPTDEGYNESIGGYERPPLYFSLIGLDTDDDEVMDIYYGFYGISFFDVSHYNYTNAPLELFWIVVNARWRLRIPQEAVDRGVKWEVLYYPDQIYNDIAVNLEYNTPIYYVNLTKQEGVNIEYRIDFGLNYTSGNFTTFGATTPLVPDVPAFPEYNVSVPLFTKTDLIEELVETDFFGSAVGFATIVSISFLLLHVIRKRRKRKKHLRE